MKPKEGVKRSKRSRKTGDFFIQLAAVVIGVIITFGGSSLIQRSAQRKEARNVLAMVRAELDQNIEGIESYRRAFEQDIADCRALAPWIVNGRPQDIPLDTLTACRSVLMTSADYEPIVNSFETLKGSQAARSLRNSELMNALYEVYSNLDNAGNADFLMQNKLDGMNRLLVSLDAATLNDLNTPEGLRNYFVDLATMEQGGAMRFYIITVANGNNHNNLKMADWMIEKIGEVQEQIDKEIL